MKDYKIILQIKYKNRGGGDNQIEFELPENVHIGQIVEVKTIERKTQILDDDIEHWDIYKTDLGFSVEQNAHILASDFT